MQFNPKIDTYISKAAPFAQDILNHLRTLIHNTVPDIKETVKWGMPHFETEKVIVASMAAFKNHCAFGFWNAALLDDTDHIFNNPDNKAMGQLGRIKALSDLPNDDILKKYIKAAAALEKNIAKSVSSISDSELEIPDEFQNALNKNKTALSHFNKMSPSHKKEYLQWITEAKRAQTKSQRIATAIEWIADGKSRHWKYEKQ